MTTGYPWHVRDAACDRLDRIMRRRDPTLFTVRNDLRADGAVYEVWRRSPDGQVHLVKRLVTDDPTQTPIHPDAMGAYILARLAEMDRDAEEVEREVDAANEALVRERWEAITDEAVEIGKYYQRAIAIEASGQASPYRRDLAEQWERLEAEAREARAAGEIA